MSRRRDGLSFAQRLPEYQCTYLSIRLFVVMPGHASAIPARVLVRFQPWAALPMGEPKRMTFAVGVDDSAFVPALPAGSAGAVPAAGAEGRGAGTAARVGQHDVGAALVE
jgi:hypothetical protein